MATLARIASRDGRKTYVRLCWCCAEQKVATPTGDPQATEAEAAAQPPKCEDCFRRSLAGLPVGRRLDS